MTDITAEELAKVNSFPRLVDLLRDKLDWPIPDDYGLEDVVFEYEPRELGLKDEDAAKLREIHQLRPLVTNQPWGVFFLSFEDKTMSVTVLRRILRALVVSKRGESKGAERAAWDKGDLIFAANFGKSGERELAFVHFSDGAATNDLPVMKVLGWNARDTKLHNDRVGHQLSKQLAWPDDPADVAEWRKQWSSAFEVRHREVISTSKELAKRLAALATDIRATVNDLLAREIEKGPLRTMLEAFRKNLIHDLDADGFADMFAQTICYGMLAARISKITPEDSSGCLVADNMADMVPRTNPFLKELFANFLKIGGRDKDKALDFDELGVRDVVDMLNRANMDRVLEDFGNRNPRKDPVIHFYEDFLREYDSEQKVDAGIFYTPPAVVGFIVRGVDEMLRTEFDLPLGLADTTTWGELAKRHDKITVPDHIDPDQPFVQILDPATGTGTFLVEVIDLIHKRMVEHWQGEHMPSADIKAAWNEYVPTHLLPRLTAFELKMAAYSIAHMKIGLKLVETGYTFGSDERAHILLTNSLQPPRDVDLEERANQIALANEGDRANSAKTAGHFTVVIGNPPYSKSITENAFILDLMAQWKKDLNETKSDLNREEWKFLRLADSEIERSGFGVVGLIINRDYIDGIVKRRMREDLLGSFPKQFHVDLNGDVKGEVADENVFDIMQGVSILLLSKCGEDVQYTSRVGTRADKTIWLEGADLATREWVTLFPIQPYFRYRPASDSTSDLMAAEYYANRKITEVFDIYSSGVQTKNDEVTVRDSSKEVEATVNFITQNNDPQCEEYFDCKSKAGWSFSSARKDLKSATHQLKGVVRYLYKPFDTKWTYWTGKTNGFHARPRREMAVHMLPSGSLGIKFNRQIVGEPSHFFVSEVLSNHGTFYLGNKGQDYLAPLWLRAVNEHQSRHPNIRGEFPKSVSRVSTLQYIDGVTSAKQLSMGEDYRHKKAEQIGLLDQPWNGRGDLEKDFGPRDLFDWIYAILHAPSYRSRYAEFLKSDFPRIPIPKDRGTFAALVPLGRRLVALHLLKPEEEPVLKNPDIRFAGTGEARVEKGYPKYRNGKVEINANRWFEDVPKETWDFHVGGYQVCDKWLKDRAGKGGQNPRPGRVLTEEDILHYRRVVTALTETRTIMAEINKAIEEHGGWPGAFKIGGEE